MQRFSLIVLGITFSLPIMAQASKSGPPADGPYARQVAEQLAKLHSETEGVRVRAAEALGFLRAYESELSLIECLKDASSRIRCQAALALARCGSRNAVRLLIDALNDSDWLTTRSAWVALTNLTGMQFAFDTPSDSPQHVEQVRKWRDWWKTVPTDRPPAEIREWLGSPQPSSGWSITASSIYKGPPNVLTDGLIGPTYWQTKNVPFPQSCTVDLGQSDEVSQVTVYQYGPQFVMTEYELATSEDGQRFNVVERKKETTPVKLVIHFAARPARYIRITSFGSKRSIYPTTFFEIQINGKSGSGRTGDASQLWRMERGLRALGALGGKGATEAILRCLGPNPPAASEYRPMVRAGIRALGRLHEEAGFQTLIGLLDNTMWARCAADALGDSGDRRAVPALIAAYSRYAKQLDGKNPSRLPADDKMTFPSEDRMLETPYAIIYALCRLPLDAPDDRAALRQIAPLLIANLPGDHDTFMLYEPEVAHRLTRYLMEQSGLRQQACEHAFEQLGQPRRVPRVDEDFQWPVFPAYRMSSCLPTVCTEKEDVPRLIALLDHEERWVRINAAKTLAWIGDRRAIEPIAKRLAEAKSEADYGYDATFKNEEYNDPAPRWRQGLIRALGLLGAHEQTDQIIRIMNDDRSVLGVRHAAAEALADLGNDQALAALRDAAVQHSFHSVRLIAQDAVRLHDELDGKRQEATGNRQEATGNRQEATGNRQEARGNRQQARGNRQQATGNRQEATGNRQEVTGKRQEVRGNRQEATGKRQEVRVEVEKRRLKWSRASACDVLGSANENSFDAVVFIKGSNSIPNTIGTVEQADRWRETYVVTDSGPVYRPGRNLYLLQPPRSDGNVTALTHFPDGYVGEPELAWDASHVLFTHRAQADPWWHVYRINVDGSGLEQLTGGPYHDVGPTYLPDGRIVFATSRAGIRDEYHGYPCTALWVMQPDGSQMHPIATNIGRDNEPAVLNDGCLVFSRLEVFYSRNKTELTLHAARPDGTQDRVVYGPERRVFWRNLDHGPRTPADGQEAPLTHRVLRMSQPQPMPDGRHIVVVTQGGLTLVGLRRDREDIITPDNKTRSYTTPFPLPDGRILCASTLKTPDREQVDLGLYLLDPAAGEVTQIYNDPASADFEPRPILTRRPPPVLADTTDADVYDGRFACASIFDSQQNEVRQRGCLVRLIEGVPVVARHSTQTNDWPVWKNHGGTFARVLGTIPVASDGSFYVDVPADRLLHFQVLDSDQRVVGNQLTWIYARPGETKSCVGCHEDPHATTQNHFPLAIQQAPVNFLPNGHEFRYRAKAWFKGHLPPEIESRTRTVRAVNLLAR